MASRWESTEETSIFLSAQQAQATGNWQLNWCFWTESRFDNDKSMAKD